MGGCGWVWVGARGRQGDVWGRDGLCVWMVGGGEGEGVVVRQVQPGAITHGCHAPSASRSPPTYEPHPGHHHIHASPL